MLKYTADVRSVMFMFITTLLLIGLWQFGGQMSLWLFVPLYVWQLLMAVSVSVMTHNHQHKSMWTNKWLNLFTDNWLTVFYGFPVFAWIPTHNANHHVHVNTEEDHTRTYRFSEKNNLLTLLTYPSISGYFQQKSVVNYFTGLWTKNRKKFIWQGTQLLSLVLWIVAALLLDWRKALMYVIIPQQLSLFSVLIFNYVQHIHADEETEFNNSRNMTGSILNFILLNNGYHTAHHLNPTVHWSLLKEKHEAVAHKIDDSLNETNFFWFLFRTYILSIFIPSFKSKSMRLARIQAAKK